MSLDDTLSVIKKFIPKRIFNLFQKPYHYLLAFLGAVIYGFPSKKLIVIGVTGTKGKTTTTELINAIFEEAGFTTAIVSTLRFKIDDRSTDNKFKMTMPGRFFLQRFLADALNANVTHAIIEMSSEGVPLFRHRFIYPDALVFTNIEPEHIEAHGSYEKYVRAKLEIARRVLHNGKSRKIFIGNADDKEIEGFKKIGIKDSFLYGLKDGEPYELSENGAMITFRGKEIHTKLLGEFNIYNMLAAATLAESFGIPVDTIKAAFEKWKGTRGRVEKIEEGQQFTVIVDYAHTPRSLESLYQAFPDRRKICVLSGTGGGRDKWKRPLMGSIADQYCDEIIMTDEDPYDENPHLIIEDIKKGIALHEPTIIIDRREAIAEALRRAKNADVVLLTGKGTDPYIMGPRGKKTPWSDALIAKEEIHKLLSEQNHA